MRSSSAWLTTESFTRARVRSSRSFDSASWTFVSSSAAFAARTSASAAVRFQGGLTGGGELGFPGQNRGNFFPRFAKKEIEPGRPKKDQSAENDPEGAAGFRAVDAPVDLQVVERGPFRAHVHRQEQYARGGPGSKSPQSSREGLYENDAVAEKEVERGAAGDRGEIADDGVHREPPHEEPHEQEVSEDGDETGGTVEEDEATEWLSGSIPIAPGPVLVPKEVVDDP